MRSISYIAFFMAIIVSSTFAQDNPSKPDIKPNRVETETDEKRALTERIFENS